MITNFILSILYYSIVAITSPLRLLPDVSLSPEISNSIATAGAYMNSIDFIVPTTTIMTIFGLFLAVEFGILSFKGINWLIRKIPGIN